MLVHAGCMPVGSAGLRDVFVLKQEAERVFDSKHITHLVVYSTLRQLR